MSHIVVRSILRPELGAVRLQGERRKKEEKTRERLAKGELGVDFYGLRAKLAELGVEYVDEQPLSKSTSGR